MARCIARHRKAMEGALKQERKVSSGIAKAEATVECASPPCLMREIDPAYFWFTPEKQSEAGAPGDEVVPTAPDGRADETDPAQ